MAAVVRPRRPLRWGQRLPEGQPVRLGGWRRATGESDWMKRNSAYIYLFINFQNLDSQHDTSKQKLKIPLKFLVALAILLT